MQFFTERIGTTAAPQSVCTKYASLIRSTTAGKLYRKSARDLEKGNYILIEEKVEDQEEEDEEAEEEEVKQNEDDVHTNGILLEQRNKSVYTNNYSKKHKQENQNFVVHSMFPRQRSCFEMKKCGSTASKSLEQLAEATNSIEIDGATTSVVQRKEEQICQHFSLRGYVADMRVQNPNVCNPFESLENTESLWEKLRGPLHVPRFRLPGCENCVRRVGPYSTPANQRLNAEQASLQICIPVSSSVEHRAGGDAITRDSKKDSIEVIILDDSEDEDVVELTASLEELTRDEEKASASNGVTTDTLRIKKKMPCLEKGDSKKASVEVIILDDSEDEDVVELTASLLRKKEKRPCLDKSKNIIIEVEDDGQAIGESSRPWGDTETEVEDNDQTSGFLKPSRNINRGPPYGQAVLDDLNARIASTANTLRNQQKQRRNISSSSTLDLSLSLWIPGTEGNQKVKDEGISVESNRKRKATVDALNNVSESSLKSRRQMGMGKFLGKPFTSCEIIDVESASFNADGTTRPVAIAYAKHDPTQRSYAKATGESSLPGGDEHKGPVKKSGTGPNPRVQHMSNMTAPYTINQECISNRNPADFSMPPEN
ncbi:hypothetical protein POM88_033860 [Heracleum sosnowskyi]|uniref:Uncharacterized protein n=1 Tax=Heracleum sosnowskyi TaxID=360622 RepID=A0AAD8HK42_9APIA|nr:hypothetical protein POM88_033860 [Heracleum sosnowskyi]